MLISLAATVNIMGTASDRANTSVLNMFDAAHNSALSAFSASQSIERKVNLRAAAKEKAKERIGRRCALEHSETAHHSNNKALLT